MNGLTWLLRLDLPSGGVYLNDGGVTVWGGNTYTAEHPVIGSLAQIGELTEGFGSQLPEQEIILAPPSNAALASLQAGAFARSAMRLWLAEYDADTGAVVGTPELRFAGRMDRVRQQFAFQQLQIVVSGVPETEVMLFSDDGNGLSASFHKQVYPGETGHDQATGLVRPVTWGVESAAPRGGVSGGGAGGGGGNGFGSDIFENAR
jgi:hypothetical protein